MAYILPIRVGIDVAEVPPICGDATQPSPFYNLNHLRRFHEKDTSGFGHGSGVRLERRGDAAAAGGCRLGVYYR